MAEPFRPSGSGFPTLMSITENGDDAQVNQKRSLLVAVMIPGLSRVTEGRRSWLSTCTYDHHEWEALNAGIGAGRAGGGGP